MSAEPIPTAGSRTDPTQVRARGSSLTSPSPHRPDFKTELLLDEAVPSGKYEYGVRLRLNRGVLPKCQLNKFSTVVRATLAEKVTVLRAIGSQYLVDAVIDFPHQPPPGIESRARQRLSTGLEIAEKRCVRRMTW